MRAICGSILMPITAALCFGQENIAHKNELALGLGGLTSIRVSDSKELDLGPGVAYQLNYARRILSHKTFAIYGEVHFLANPQRKVSSSLPSATRDVASLYITPGVRLKLRPDRRLSPYFAAGGGYADYEQSTTQLDGRPNAAPRELSRGVVDFGAGIDLHVWRGVALRAEARDFYSGHPAYNVAMVSGGQNNLAAGAAIVLNWH